MSRRRVEEADVNIWRAPELNAELLHGRFVDFEYDVHSHETACFALLTAGQICIRMRGGEFVARKGDLYAIDADESHAGWAIDEGGFELRTLYVDVHHLRAIVGDERAHRQVSIAGPIVQDDRLSQWLSAMHQCSEVHGPALVRDEAYIRFAQGLFGRYVRDAAPAASVGQEVLAVRRGRDFLDQNLGNQVSLKALAAHAGVPPFVLFRAFERALGMTPHGYQRQARVRTVMRLLRLGYSIANASNLAGFADQSHCTRWFRRLMGITPGQYQMSVLGPAQHAVQ